MRAALYQCESTTDLDCNLQKLAQAAREASAHGADLLVAPEAFMYPFGAGRLDVIAESLDGPFVGSVSALAEQYSLTIILGMFSPADQLHKDGKVINRVYNIALVATADGGIKTYTKIHTYDAFGFKESDTVKRGSDFVTVDIPVGEGETVRLGLAICYDIRFPEQFVELALAGAKVIVVPTSWADGPGKLEQWRILQSARALDSTSFVLTAGQARPGGREFAGQESGPTGIGHSGCWRPDGSCQRELGYDEELAIVDLDLGSVQGIRDQLPVLVNR